MSLVERLSSFQRLEMYLCYAIGKGPRGVSLVERLSSIQRLSCELISLHYIDEKNTPPNQPTAYLPPDSPLLSTQHMERKCPVCEHVFLALSQQEFQTHVAVCYR